MEEVSGSNRLRQGTHSQKTTDPLHAVTGLDDFADEALIYHVKSSCKSAVVEHIGFEPMTSSMPWKRASQLRQCPVFHCVPVVPYALRCSVGR